MKRQSVIILIQPLSEPIARGNFKKLCEEYNFSYHGLKMLKFPILFCSLKLPLYICFIINTKNKYYENL